MKWFSAFCFVFCFIVFTNYSFAQSGCCPAPLQDTTISGYIYNISKTDSCEVDVTFCHDIGPSGTRFMKICSATIEGDCDLDVNLSDGSFWEQIFDIVIDFSDSQSSFPPCSTLNQTSVTVEITKAECWILKNDPINLQYVFEPCDGEEAECYREYKVCWSGGELLKTFQSSYTTGESDCYYESGFVLDPDTFPFDECFETCY